MHPVDSTCSHTSWKKKDNDSEEKTCFLSTPQSYRPWRSKRCVSRRFDGLLSLNSTRGRRVLSQMADSKEDSRFLPFTIYRSYNSQMAIPTLGREGGVVSKRRASSIHPSSTSQSKKKGAMRIRDTGAITLWGLNGSHSLSLCGSLDRRDRCFVC